jgi:type II secretory pathway component PulF
MGQNEKWLVALLKSISETQWFFLVFGAIAVFFAKLMLNHRNRMTQRNFKKEDRVKPSKSKSLVKKN